MAEALSDVRIIELGSSPAAGLAGMILADFGAEVLRVAHPSGNADDNLPAASMYRRGKATAMLDHNNPADREQLDALCGAADVLLCSLAPEALAAARLDFASLEARCSQLILAHVTGYGADGPIANLPAYEHVAAAYAGRMLVFQGIVDRPGPVFSALQVATHACAQSTATGIMAALLARGEAGSGTLIETSLLQGLLPYEQGPMLGNQFRERFEALLAYMDVSAEPPLPSLYYHPAQAGDGRWMQFGNLLPHLFDNFLIVTDLIDVIADEGFDPKQLLLRPAEKHEAFRERMLKRIQEQPAAAWMDAFINDGGIVGTTYQTTQEALEDPDIVANGHVVDRPDGGVELGPLARLSGTPANIGRGEIDADALVARWFQNPRRPSGADAGLPLEGIRVVELATIIAAPMGASLLADMGADVVKVEQIGGDPFRSMLNGIGASRVNPGKRSISVDLKSTAGQEAVLKLLATADVVIHNYRPGVPERLGIDYEVVRTLNPNVVYLQSNGYGPDGPGALRPSTHPIPGAAMGGVMYQMGKALPGELQDFQSLRTWTSRLMRANEVNPDPNTALVIATSALLGLSARERTGLGQQIFVDMFGANAWANHDDFFRYPGKPPRPLADAAMYGLNALYRLYPCAEDQWVFLAAPTPAEQQRFREALQSAGYEPPSAEVLAAADAGTADALMTLFEAATADTWQALLVPAGVACVRADAAQPSEFWLNDPQSATNEFVSTAQHPRWGAYRRHGPMVIFGGSKPVLAGPPLAGQHNAEVLAELGYGESQISELTAAGVLWQEEA